jgi:hypothetical protein
MSSFDDYSEVSPLRSKDEALEWARPQLTDAEREDPLFQAFLQRFAGDVEAGLSVERMLSMARELTEKCRASMSEDFVESQIIPRLLGKGVRSRGPSPEAEAWWAEVTRPRIELDSSWDREYVGTLAELVLLRKLKELGHDVVEGDELHERVLSSLIHIVVPLRVNGTAEFLLPSEDPDGKGTWIELNAEDLIIEDAKGTAREDLLSKPAATSKSNVGLILVIVAALAALVIFLLTR